MPKQKQQFDFKELTDEQFDSFMQEIKQEELKRMWSRKPAEQDLTTQLDVKNFGKPVEINYMQGNTLTVAQGLFKGLVEGWVMVSNEATNQRHKFRASDLLSIEWL